jgi:hypothetical protein
MAMAAPIIFGQLLTAKARLEAIESAKTTIGQELLFDKPCHHY